MIGSLPRWAAAIALALLAALQPATASTDGPPGAWALNELGGTAADRQMLYSGTPGVLMGTTPSSLLLVGWRRLHGQTVSTEAGEALTIPCCTGAPGGGSDAVQRWEALRKTVPGAAPQQPFIPTERRGPDYTSIPNCLDDAFRNAAETLQARIQSYSATSPDVQAWVAAQDAVFTACSTPVASLPALADTAPAWLQADHRYQAAALAFYNADFPAAAGAFAAVAQDTTSPWHDSAPYLRARALLRQALASKATADLDAARKAAQEAAAALPFQAAAKRLEGMAELRAQPEAARARLLAALQSPELTVQVAYDFKDLQALGAGPTVPDMLDWIDTFKTGAAAPPVPANDKGTLLEQARAADGRRAAALAHARDRYAATHDSAWMLAALALMQPDDASDAGFMGEVAALDPSSPGYLTALYHRLRLTLPAMEPAAARTLLDTVLSRTDLTTTTRNLFLAERLQLAATLVETARFSLRQIVCPQAASGCKSTDWGYLGRTAGSFDALRDDATRGLGDDARYLIDRMDLATRTALAAEPSLPAPIRLDIALTSFARAVLMHDDAAADALAAALQALLPVMAADFAAIPKAKPGPEKLFAQYLVFAKIPSLRADLVDYTRPTGAVSEFDGSWPNWVVLKQPDPTAVAPAPVLYGSGDYLVQDVPAGTDLGSGRRRIPDVICNGMCGAGGFVPRLPPFLADTAAKATLQRRFLPPPGKYGDAGVSPSARADAFPSVAQDQPTKALPAPPGATYVWEYLLDYASRHPQDPRAPETLHWLIHVGHYGLSHYHSGRRAFLLLRSRYPASTWAKQNQYYFD